METATWVVAGATVVLVLVTGFYAFHTWRIATKTAEAGESARQSAAAAERSAKGAEDMVEIERERQREPGRPEITLTWATTDPSPGDPSRRAVRLWVQNTGPGDAYEVTFSCRVECNGTVHPSSVEKHPPIRIQPQTKPQKAAVISYPDVRGPVHLVIMCHYSDTYSTTARPRAYHSVFDATEGNAYPSRYYRLDQPLESRYAGICCACRGAR